MSKSEVRASYRKLRRAVTPDDRKAAALSAVRHLENEAIFKESYRVACYLPHKEEFDSVPLIEKIWESGKRCYLPILTEEKTLKFVRYKKGDALELNRYSIKEPVNISRKVEIKKLDLIILPVIAFDSFGHRLGTGGGYYDRTLAGLYHEDESRPYILGLSYSLQQVGELPNDPWDVAMDGVLTEKAWLSTRQE